MQKKKTPLKMDAINKKILATIHMNADMSNQELAEEIGLSPSACFQRVKALKEAGYVFNFHSEIDLDSVFEHILAYVEFTLHENGATARKAFENRIEEIPEFMDCLRITGDTDYISFTCCSDIQTLNALCDEMSADESLGIKKIKTRVVMERSKWYLGYPLAKLKWLE